MTYSPRILATALVLGGLTLGGCSSDNNEVSIEVMQNNPENFMPELSPAQKAEMDKQNQVIRNRGFLDLKPKEKPEKDGADTHPASN